MEYKELIAKIKEQNDSIKRKLIIDINKLLLQNSTINEGLPLVCPYCKSKYIVKNGKNKDKQRYLCKNCRKSFILQTNTPIYNSKKDIVTWINYCECLFAQKSLRDISSELNIALSTAFFWRHKLLDAINEHSNNQILKDSIQCDETFFNESFKGNHSKDGFIMPRKPYKRGKSCKIRGISRQKVCVLSAIDNTNSLVLCPVTMGKPSSSDIVRALKSKVESQSLLITDSLYSYKSAASFLNLKHISIPAKKHTLGEYNIQKINNIHSQIKSFFVKYRGVATKYLFSYLSLFHYIFDKKEELPIKIKGDTPYKISNFKGRPPIFL